LLQLTIEDGGPNDTDQLANHVVTDPGTLSLVKGESDNESQGGGAGTMPWLLMSLLLLRLFLCEKDCFTKEQDVK